MSLSRKHDAGEKITNEMQDNEDSDDEQISLKIREVNKLMDKKRKEGLKVLKKKLADIINDDALHASARLQKLYEDSEITEFMQELLN